MEMELVIAPMFLTVPNVITVESMNECIEMEME